MANTVIEDVFYPVQWELFFIEMTAEMARFLASGIMQVTDKFNELASGSGILIEMPFWKDLTGDREIPQSNVASVPEAISDEKDRARMQFDMKSWSANFLVEEIAGSDPMTAIGELVGRYWMRQDEKKLISSLKGIMAKFVADGNINVLNISVNNWTLITPNTVLNGSTFIRGKQKLGDAQDSLVAMAMHSEVRAYLLDLNQISTVPPADGREQLYFFQGFPVIADDSMPRTVHADGAVIYTTVLFGPGAIAKGNGTLTKPVKGGHGTEAVEFARDALKSDDLFINRRKGLMHGRGIAWTESSVAAKAGPTNAELEMSANWNRVFEAKNIRLVFIQHNIEQLAAVVA